jgi:hypothetical protein
MPHLGDISITNRGEYGAYREATINVKCYNPKQFEIINILYLSVGYTVLLEWGHNCYFNNKEEFILDNTTSLQQYFFDKKNANNHIGLFQAIKSKRKESDGNFDGLFGYVTNYTWTFENGVYNIDIKLTSIGSIAESLTINTYGNITGSNAEPQNNSISTLLDGFDKGLIPELGEKIAISSAQFDNNSEIRFGNISQTQIDLEQNQNSQYTDEGGNPIFEDTQKTNPTSDPSKPTKAYQTTQQSLINVAKALKIEPSDAFIGSTIDFIKFLKTDGTTNNTKHLKYIRFGALLEFIEKTELIYNFTGENSPQPLLKIDYNPETNFMATFPFMIVTDPFNCIFNSGELTRIDSYNPDVSSQFKNLPEFKTSEYGGIVVGKVMNVFLNSGMVNDILTNIIDDKGNINLVKFLQSLCDKISTSVGHLSELKVSIDEENNVLKIIENGELPNKKKILESFKIPTTYSSFDVFGYSNFNKENQSAGFVKSFNIKTQITNDIYTTAVLGAQQAGYPTKNVDPTNFSYMYRGLQDRIISYKQTISDKNIQNDSEEERRKRNQEIYSKATKTYDEILGFRNDFKYGINDKILKFSEDDILNYKSAIRSLIEERKRYSLQVGGVSNIQYMPINFSMTLDGLSGMKIFQNFKADSKFLPYPYPEVITLNINPSIRHKISNNVWTTEVETKFVPEFVKSKNFIETTEQTTKDGFYGTNSQGIGFGKGEATNNSGGFGGDLSPKGKTAPTKNPPPPRTPNADYLRGVMSRLNSEGKNFKIIERYNPKLYISSDPEFKDLPKGNAGGPVLTSNGDISEKLKNYAANVFENISTFWAEYGDGGGMKVEITAGNDISHLELTSGAHRHGRGLDFTIKTLDGKNFTKQSDTTFEYVDDYGPLDWVLTRIQELIPFEGNGGDYLDEYRFPSPSSTGGHIHLNTGTENLPSHIVNGVKYTGKKYAIKLKGEGTITPKPLKQISNIPPQSQRFI